MEWFKNKKILNSIESEITLKKADLDCTQTELAKKKDELEQLKKEIQESINHLKCLKTELDHEYLNFRNSANYYIDMKNCYVIKYQNKYYITIREIKTIKTDDYSPRTGYWMIDVITFLDAMNIQDNHFKKIYNYQISYDENNYFDSMTHNKNHTEERHILELFPELKIFTNDLIPNTLLNKIYNELNGLTNTEDVFTKVKRQKQNSEF